MSSPSTDETPTRVEPSLGLQDSGSVTEVPPSDDGVTGDEPGRGDQVGRYIIVDAIGRGGMGQVFSAYDPELDRKVALKLLRVKARRSDRRAGARLVREAQAMAKLAHPNVVTVYDAGTHGHQVFVAMEHIQGPTLKAWLAQTDRAWTEVLDVMREAGRGLAAAHAVGLVHRDFKPDNVMLGEDGRARVLDFGLARRFGDDSVDEEASFDSDSELPVLERSGPGPDVALTATGMVLGTPRYMAPEQFCGGHIDARTDQFAFCVALYRALFRVAPFPGEDYSSLGKAVLRGELTTPPRVPGVPRAVRQAVERGLGVNKDDRFASMEPLLEILDKARSSRRRRALLGGLAVGVVTVGVAASSMPAEGVAPCADVGARLDAAWGEERKSAVLGAFEAAEVAFADDAAERVSRVLDDYSTRWREARVDACEATRVRGEQSESLMDRRVACLEGRRQRLDALTEVLAQADAEVVQEAVDAVGQLPSLARCSDAEALLADVAPPEDPEVAAAVDELRAELARADAARLAGRYAEGIELAAPLIERARGVDHPAIVAEVARVLGMLYERRGDAEQAFASLDEALWAAIASGHDFEQAQALLALVTLESDHHPDGIALRHARHARAVLARMGEPPELVALLQMNVGTVHMRRREWDEAEAGYSRAVELAGDLPAARGVKLSALGNNATILGMRGRYEEALRLNEEARALGVEHLGPNHPKVAKLVHNHGNTLLKAGRPREAIEVLVEAQTTMEASMGARHPEVARVMANIGYAYQALRDWANCLRYAQPALELKRETLGPDHPSVAISANNVGEALYHLGRIEESLAAYEDALRIFGDRPERVYVQGGHALALIADGRLEEGIALALDVLERVETVEMSQLDRGEIRFEVAQSLVQSPSHRARALELARSAREAMASDEGDATVELRELDAWLAEHGG